VGIILVKINREYPFSNKNNKRTVNKLIILSINHCIKVKVMKNLSMFADINALIALRISMIDYHII
jgi:hypothetical protein